MRGTLSISPLWPLSPYNLIARGCLNFFTEWLGCFLPMLPLAVCLAIMSLYSLPPRSHCLLLFCSWLFLSLLLRRTLVIPGTFPIFISFISSAKSLCHQGDIHKFWWLPHGLLGAIIPAKILGDSKILRWIRIWWSKVFSFPFLHLRGKKEKREGNYLESLKSFLIIYICTT